jgi:hypothetical protein
MKGAPREGHKRGLQSPSPTGSKPRSRCPLKWLQLLRQRPEPVIAEVRRVCNS